MPQEKFKQIMDSSLELFKKKMSDYGATWMLFRYESIADQLWIKIKRVRVLEENNDHSLVNEGRRDEFVGIFNYAIIAWMRLKFPEVFPDTEKVMENTALLETITTDIACDSYVKVANMARELMERKNHDYGDAWRSMSRAAITDQIIIKILRIKNILRNGGKLLASENIDAQFFDVINYCIFALIKIDEEGK